jgi:hypothetical protein
MRDALGDEKLFNLDIDPFEYIDLTKLPDGEQQVAVFRKKLLDVLAENHASVEVESSYLKPFRDRLQALVQKPGPAIVTAAPAQNKRAAQN